MLIRSKGVKEKLAQMEVNLDVKDGVLVLSSSKDPDVRIDIRATQDWDTTITFDLD